MCVCLCVAPKLYEKSEFANATDTNMTFTTKIAGRCKAMQDPLTNSDFLYTSILGSGWVYVCVLVCCTEIIRKNQNLLMQQTQI